MVPQSETSRSERMKQLFPSHTEIHAALRRCSGQPIGAGIAVHFCVPVEVERRVREMQEFQNHMHNVTSMVLFGSAIIPVRHGLGWARGFSDEFISLAESSCLQRPLLHG